MLQICNTVISVSAVIVMTPNNPGVDKIPRKQNYPGLDVAFENAKRIIDIEFSQIDGLDTKARIFIGFSGALITLTLTVLPTVIRYIDYLTIGLVLAEVLYTFISLLCAMIAIVPQEYENAPSIEILRYYLTSEEVPKLDIFEEFENVVKRNHRKMKIKIHFVNLSLVILLVGIILFPFILLSQSLLFAIR